MIEELSASRRKLIASLKSAKHRRRAGLFAIEGTKSVLDTLGMFECEWVVATHGWIEEYGDRLKNGVILKATRADMERVTALSTAPDVIAVCRIPVKEFDPDVARRELVVALDGVQDPGNLGTIVRACDWFGVSTVLCSHDTVDLYNPKVIQSTMGAMSRVAVHYVDLSSVLRTIGDVPVYGTFLDGEDLYAADLSPTGIIVMGNEGNGISRAVGDLINRRLLIPAYPAGDDGHVESLNVSMATAISLAEFRRRVRVTR